MDHRALATLQAGLDEIRRSPTDVGRLELIVRRPAEDRREVLTVGELDHDEGLVGDSWRLRGRYRAPADPPDPDKQVTIMNSRVAYLVAGTLERRALAGDQLYLDFDLSEATLPAGSRLRIGEAVIEITEPPHLGCVKFAHRFGNDALRFINAAANRPLRLRGANARVVVAGTVTAGDDVRRLAT